MIRRLSLPALVLAVALACGGGGGDSTPPTGIVQLVSVTTNVLTMSCGRMNHLANPDSLYLLAHLVNTTANDVTIDSIGSTGQIIRASDTLQVGLYTLINTSLPYHPRPALLQAHTGDLTLTVSLPTTSLCAGNSAVLDYKDINVSVRVTTGAGQFVSLPMTIHVVYQN